MFRRRHQELLPMASGRRETGLKASQVMNAPTMSSSHKTAAVIFALSMICAVTGYSFCSWNSKMISLTCVRGGQCHYVASVGDPEVDGEVTFAADNLRSADTVRMRKGIVQDVTGMKRRKQRKLQYGYEVHYYTNEGDKTTLQMATWNIGRKRPKTQAELALNWAEGNGEDRLFLKESTFVSVTGVIFFCIAGIGAILSLLIGCIFDESSSKRPRRKYVPRKVKR